MKVLVVIPTHDRTEFLDEAIASVQAQTRPPDEVIITGNVGHPAYPSVYSEAPLADRLNEAIAASECDAFIVLCDDDVLLPRFIELTLRAMQEADADIIYCTNVTSLYRKSIWAKTCGFRSVGFFDWDFYWSCLEAGAKCVPFGTGLFMYREHPEQIARHAAWRADGSWARWEAEMYERHPRRGRSDV